MKVIYTGTDGARNPEVARATGGPSRMKHGKTYSVPASLGKRLLATQVWQAVRTRPRKRGHETEE